MWSGWCSSSIPKVFCLKTPYEGASRIEVQKGVSFWVRIDRLRVWMMS
jgi:hypothetical protein